MKKCSKKVNKNKNAVCRAAGICVTCRMNLGDILANSKYSNCESCRAKNTNKVKELKEKGICVYCRKRKANSGNTMCLECMEARRNKRKKLRDKGVCVSCEKNDSKINSTYCEACLEQHRKRRTIFEQNGLCVKCGEERTADRNKWCDKCYLKETSARHFGSIIFWQELFELFKKNEQCPYTGEKLILGDNTVLDHIVPKSKGGTNELHNLQWVSKIANCMKWDNTEEEFFEIILKIYNFRGLKNA